MKLSIRQLTVNAMLAAIYVVITIFLPSYGALQLRLSEMFAHLPVINRKYSIGLILGVAIANTQSSLGISDVIFGTIHTIVSIWLVSLIIKESDSMIKKLVINSAVFSLTSFILALMDGVLNEQMAIFWTLYGSFAISIALVMLVTIPVIIILDKRVNLNKVMEERA